MQHQNLSAILHRLLKGTLDIKMNAPFEAALIKLRSRNKQHSVTSPESTRSWTSRVHCLHAWQSLMLHKLATVLVKEKLENLWIVFKIQGAISRTTRPILGMFVLIRMHFSWWIQIWKKTLRNGEKNQQVFKKLSSV